MMAKKNLLTPCPLCLQEAPASFEHVPPESCDNDVPAEVFSLDQRLIKPDGKPLIQQRGHGYFSLCTPCNNHLGRYNRAFSDWESVCRNSKTLAGSTIKAKFYPQRIMKAVLGMFVSTHPDLAADERVREYLLEPSSTGWPERLRLFAFSRQGTVLRATGGFFLLGYGGDVFAMAEVHTQAVGYVLSLDGKCWSPSFTDITHFADHGYDDEVDVEVFLWPVPVTTEIPGDYRTELMVHERVSHRPVLVGKSGYKSRAFNKRRPT